MKDHSLSDGFTFAVKPINQYVLSFSRDLTPTGFGYLFGAEMATAAKRAGITCASFNEGTIPNTESVTLLANTWSSSYIPVLCSPIDESTTQFLRLTDSLEQFLVQNNNFTEINDTFQSLVDKVTQINSRFSLKACAGSVMDVLTMTLDSIEDNVKYYSASEEVQKFVKQLLQNKISLEQLKIKLDQATNYVETTFPPDIHWYYYISWLYGILQNKYKIELILILSLTSLSCICCCSCCQLFDCFCNILSIVCKVLWCLISFLVVAPLSRGTNILRERWVNVGETHTQDVQSPDHGTPVRRLNHSMLTFHPRTRTYGNNLLRSSSHNNVQFVLPTLSELDRYDRSRTPRITESRLTEVV